MCATLILLKSMKGFGRYRYIQSNFFVVIIKEKIMARCACSSNKGKAIFAHQEFSFCESSRVETVLKPAIAFQTDTLRNQQRNHFHAGAPVQYPDELVPLNRPLMFIKGIEIPLNRCKAFQQSLWNIAKLFVLMLEVFFSLGDSPVNFACQLHLNLCPCSLFILAFNLRLIT